MFCNTPLVVFTSDNGARGDFGGSNGSLRGRKGTTWEGGQRVPCIMRWTGKIPAGLVCNEITASLDFMPTLARLAGIDAPSDRIIGGKNIQPLMFGEKGAASPHDTFFYYFKNNIDAVRSGKWKLHIRKGDKEIRELYDLTADISEANNLYDRHPEVVKELEEKIRLCREDIGDETAGMDGANCRSIGRVKNPDTLTHYDPNHPYIMAMYDLPDAG